jgi:YYY domain-containing protein
VLLDWITREGWIIVNWWLLVTIAGATALPLMLRLLAGLPDRGYTLARPAGMLLVAFVFWLLAVLGFVQNTAGSMVLAWLIVLSVSLGMYFGTGGPLDLRTWWRENRTAITIYEVLFIVLLVGWAIFRAYQNELQTTEKPMDLAFLSASQRSLTYPPDDPWLAGYAISYYYFGYVMAAMLSMLSGIWSTIGYNMHIALLFALTGASSFSVVYNLVRSRAMPRANLEPEDEAPARSPSRTTAALYGLLAMIFVVLLGNFYTPLVEIPYQGGAASQGYLNFWDVNQRRTPLPDEVSRTSVSEWDYWWWFRAARTISDRQLEPAAEAHIEVIAEFPQFSFVLGDSHPHVMALPFVLLSIGLALNILLSQQRPGTSQVLFYGICVGSLVFLNTWDNPIYIALMVGAEGIRRLLAQGRLVSRDWLQLLIFGLLLLAITLVAYFPFLAGFRSQLGGVLPNVAHPTQFPQFFLMMGPFMLILAAFLAVEIWRGRQSGHINWPLGWQFTGGIMLALLLGVVLFSLLGWISPALRGGALAAIEQRGGWGAVLPEIFQRRIYALPTLLVILAGLVVVVARLYPRAGENEPRRYTAYPAATGFALLLAGIGLGLVLIPEFLYLRDNFGTRMNTVFKFYYQAWITLSIAGAYGVYTLISDDHQPRPAFPVRLVTGALVVALLAAGLIYPALATYHRMFIETGRATAANPTPPTLDGGLGFVATDDYVVIMCLRERVGRDDVIVAEAERASYNPRYGRVGALTGIPILLGWDNHQRQWRGATYNEAVGTRKTDLQLLYTDLRMDVVQPIIDRYSIDYILFGATERADYGSAGEEKFQESLEVVCEAGGSRIYRVGKRSDVLASD